MMNYHNSKVTLELGELVDSGIKVWNFDYPSFYQGAEKIAFEELVLDHYRFRQIGMETPGRWLHSFRTRIREIMPYYIQLYESVELMANVDDPFKAYDLTETFTKTTTGNETLIDSTSSTRSGSTTNTGETIRTGGTTTTTETQKDASDTFEKKFSDTPQGSVTHLDSYLTEVTKEDRSITDTVNTSEDVAITDTTNVDDKTTISDSVKTNINESTNSEGSETYTLKRFGNIGVQPLGQEIEAYRKALINVDMMVINELNDLFLKVY